MPAQSHDPTIDHAREEADGVEVFTDETTPSGALLRQAEGAQGVEAFVDPNSTVPGKALVEGTEGEETFTGNEVAPAFDDDYREEDG